jgi:hypothetical protein
MFKKVVKVVKLMSRRASLEQQVIFLSHCLSNDVFPSSVSQVRLPVDLRNDSHLHVTIMRTITTKLRRLVYARKANCIFAEAELSAHIRSHVHPRLFESILKISQSEYEKQVVLHRMRCQKKFFGLTKKKSMSVASSSLLCTQSASHANTRISQQRHPSSGIPVPPPPHVLVENFSFSNFTDVELSDAEKSLLAKGPNFFLAQNTTSRR